MLFILIKVLLVCESVCPQSQVPGWLVTINVQLYPLVTMVQCPKCHVIVVSFANFLLQGYFGLSVATAEPNYYTSHCKIHFREVGIVDVCLLADTFL